MRRSPVASKPKPSRVKVREHGARLRSQGLRPIQIWVPDVRAPTFLSEAHRQSLAVSRITICAFTTDETASPLFRLPVEPTAHNGLRTPT
jgi:Protein  of unknown function (DUF3018)